LCQRRCGRWDSWLDRYRIHDWSLRSPEPRSLRRRIMESYPASLGSRGDPPIAALRPAPFFGSTRRPTAAKSNRTSLLVMVAGTIGTATGCGAGSAARNCHPKYAKLPPTRTAANSTAPIMTFYVTTPIPCEARSQGESAFGPRLLPPSSTTTQCCCARRMALTEASACWQTAMSPARSAARARSRESSATSKSRPREPSVAASEKGVG
jgi:hypothetical protein